eukprot:5426038-Amphidinium_carterae.1
MPLLVLLCGLLLLLCHATSLHSVAAVVRACFCARTCVRVILCARISVCMRVGVCVWRGDISTSKGSFEDLRHHLPELFSSSAMLVFAELVGIVS